MWQPALVCEEAVQRIQRVPARSLLITVIFALLGFATANIKQKVCEPAGEAINCTNMGLIVGFLNGPNCFLLSADLLGSGNARWTRKKTTTNVSHMIGQRDPVAKVTTSLHQSQLIDWYCGSRLSDSVQCTTKTCLVTWTHITLCFCTFPGHSGDNTAVTKW